MSAGHWCKQCLNPFTYGYTMAFCDWPRWERV